MKKELYIRADGNEIIGIGHLMRCFVYATEWERCYGRCYFIAADEVTKSFVTEHGFECFVLNSSWNDLDAEILKVKELLTHQSAEILLIDSYYYTSKYISELKDRVLVAVIGDRIKETSLADIIINYNIYASQDQYMDIGANTTLLLGTEYYPLRPEFIKHQIPITHKVSRIYLTAGGTDPFNLLYEVGKRLIKQGFIVDAVTGKFNKNLPQLWELQGNSTLFHLYTDISNVAEVMGKCQIAISAGGITLYELCAMGIPTITYAFADNQLSAVHAMQDRGIMLNVGDIRSDISTKIPQIIQHISDLSENIEMREAMASRMSTIIDGKGAERVCYHLLHRGGKKDEISVTSIN